MPSQPTTNNNPFLPIDVYSHIFSHLPLASLKSCRLLSRSLSPMATSRAFHHIYLSASNPKSSVSFTEIAQSPRLRSQVTRITLDTWVGPQFRYNANESFDWPLEFLRALPYLRFFTGTRALCVRFTEWCGNEDRSGYMSYEENYDFRWRVLGTVFDCAAGMWIQQKQLEWDDEVLERDSWSQSEADETSESVEENAATEALFDCDLAMPLLKTLMITNLVEYDDKRLTESEAFKRVMHSPSLTELKLLIACESDRASPESSIQFPEKYEFFGTLDKTWLSPPIARKLEVLSLYYRDYWGWAPRVEFRKMNPGFGPTDPSAGFPKLRVLALGNYVFSHDWQIDWIASLGKQNGYGGLQELYLDDCPIIWYATVEAPLASGTTVIELDKDEDGNDSKLEISNEGYPREDVLTGTYIGATEWGLIRKWEIRWSDIFAQWRQSMPGLTTLQMGHGSWNGEYTNLVYHANTTSAEFATSDAKAAAVAGNGGEPKPENWAKQRDDNIRQSHPYEDCIHLTYNCPNPAADLMDGYAHVGDVYGLDHREDLGRYKQGVGLRQRRVDLMQYIKFDIGTGPSQWLPDEYFTSNMSEEEERTLWKNETLQDDDPSLRVMPEFKEVMRRDEEAFAELMGVVEQRRVKGAVGR